MEPKEKLYEITVPTGGFITYEVRADSLEEAMALLEESEGSYPKCKIIEQNIGDWEPRSEWEVVLKR